MTDIGQKERATQNRVVKLFTDTQHPHCLGYAYLGNWEERADNRNIEPALLRIWLKKQGHSEALIGKALLELDKAAQRKGP